MGAALGEELLAGAVGEALGRALAEAERLDSPFELALEPEEDLASFPWETLRLPGPGGLPGEPLALHANVRLFRRVSGLGSTPHLQVPGPLRILVAIGSPEEQNDRGELLDMEEELSRILDAVEPARKQSRPAYIRVLERGTVTAIHEALAESIALRPAQGSDKTSSAEAARAARRSQRSNRSRSRQARIFCRCA